MITATEARKQVDKHTGREEALNRCKKYTEDSIKRAIKMGRDNCCLANTSAYIDDVYYDVEIEIKEWLRDLGYTFKPTGYVGGVWQLSEQICW